MAEGTNIVTNAGLRGVSRVPSGASLIIESGATFQLASGATANIDVSFDQDVALTAAGEGHNLSTSINHATADAEGLDVSLTQLTTARTGGTCSALKVAATSLAGDSGGTYNDLELTLTDGGGSATHQAIKVGAGFDTLLDLSACATGEADIVLKDNLASAAQFRESTNAYITLVTTNSSEAVKIDQDLDLNADLDMDGATAAIDLSGVISIDAVGASNLTIDSGNLTIETTTSGILDLNAAGNFTLDAGGTVSIDGVGASNLTADSGQLTIQTTTSGDILLDSAANVLLRAVSGSEIQLQDDADNTKITAFDSSKITTGNTRTLSMADEDVNLANCVPRLIKKQVTDTDLTASATSESFNFGSAIPAKAIVTAAWFDLDEVFAGGGASSAVVDVGDGTDADGYVDNEDVFTGATLGQRSTPTTAPVLLDSNGVDIAGGARTPAVLITSDVNVDTLTTGDLTAYILYSVAPLGSAIS